jgi:hypothetical protein
MATKKPEIKPAHPKKEFKKELTVKMETALSEIKNKLGEKKFEHRIKKAAKILMQGLHTKDFAGSNGKSNEVVEASSKKIKGLKKSKVKEQEAPAS